MTAYVYIHPCPLQTAQRYDFADCADRSFIEGWRSFRQESKARLLQGMGGMDVQNHAMPECPQGAIDLYALMVTEQGLWSLLRKFEVFGKLYSYYQADGRRHPESDLAPVEAYVTFADVLLKRADDGSCYQYHSTLLKVMDALCALPVEVIGSRVAQEVSRLIDAEKELIERVERQIYGA